LIWQIGREAPRRGYEPGSMREAEEDAEWAERKSAVAIVVMVRGLFHRPHGNRVGRYRSAVWRSGESEMNEVKLGVRQEESSERLGNARCLKVDRRD
jgi:hypothetical protein